MAFLALQTRVSARFSSGWMEQGKVWKKAEFVVIAKALSTKETAERTILGDLQPPLEAAGVETEFETQLVLKGCKTIKSPQMIALRREHRTVHAPRFFL